MFSLLRKKKEVKIKCCRLYLFKRLFFGEHSTKLKMFTHTLTNTYAGVFHFVKIDLINI